MIAYLRRCLPRPYGTPDHHRTPIKGVINTVLRFLQLWCTDRPWLLWSVEVHDGERWTWTGRYRFARGKTSH